MKKVRGERYPLVDCSVDYVILRALLTVSCFSVLIRLLWDVADHFVSSFKRCVSYLMVTGQVL